MLNYTIAVIHGTVNDLKRFFFVFSLITQVLYIAYLLYVIIANISNMHVNITLCILSVCYLIFFLVIHSKHDKFAKVTKRIVRRSYKWSKLAINCFTLGVAVYGIYLTSNNANVITVVLTALMIIFWIMQVILEIIIYFFEQKYDLLIAGLERDVEFISKPVNTIGNIVHRIKGEDPVPMPTVPNKVKDALDKALLEHKKYKAEKRQQKR